MRTLSAVGSTPSRPRSRALMASPGVDSGKVAVAFPTRMVKPGGDCGTRQRPDSGEGYGQRTALLPTTTITGHVHRARGQTRSVEMAFMGAVAPAVDKHAHTFLKFRRLETERDTSCRQARTQAHEISARQQVLEVG